MPYAEFAHNSKTHKATGKSLFEIWYGYQPEFTELIIVTSQVQSAEECLKQLRTIRKEVTAALNVTAEIMKHKRPRESRFEPQIGDLAWLKGTNIHITHSKTKLAPRRHDPFKVVWATSTNCKLKLLIYWKIPPIFHNSLVKGYKERPEHSLNYLRPLPEVVANEKGHYKIEFI